MEALKDYYALIDRITEECLRIRRCYGARITCRKGCPGNCCRIHLSLFAVEAFALALALRELPPAMVARVRRRAASTTAFGPCPLLEDGACLMYVARLLICRTHGLPMRSAYRGREIVGCCQKNFSGPAPVPKDACIDLDPVNRSLAEVNRRFLAGSHGRLFPRNHRVYLNEALMLDLPLADSVHRRRLWLTD